MHQHVVRNAQMYVHGCESALDSKLNSATRIAATNAPFVYSAVNIGWLEATVRFLIPCNLSIDLYRPRDDHCAQRNMLMVHLHGCRTRQIKEKNKTKSTREQQVAKLQCADVLV